MKLIQDQRWTVTLPEGSRLRADGTSTCPRTVLGQGAHHFLPNRDRTAFACSNGCGARVTESPSPLPASDPSTPEGA
jgi:hypothetical protein